MSFLSRVFNRSDDTDSHTSSDNKPKTLKEQSRQWQRDLQRQHRLLERQKNDIVREEAKLKVAIKQSAKKNDVNNVKVMAKSIVQSKNAQTRLVEAQTRINSIIYQLQSMQATHTVVGHMGKSTEIMTAMGKLINVREVAETTQNMQREMAKAGIIDEMVNDSMSALDQDGIEDDAQVQVDQVMYELTAGQMGSLPEGMKDRTVKQPAATENKVDDTAELDEMKKVLHEQKS